MGLSQSVCGFLSCSQKENKEIKEIKVDYKTSREEHQDVKEIKEKIKKYKDKKTNEDREKDKVYCVICDNEFRADGDYQKHIRRPIHHKDVLKYIKQEFKRDDIDVDIFIECDKINAKKYNRSSDGSYSKKKVNYKQYKEYKEYKELKKKLDNKELKKNNI